MLDFNKVKAKEITFNELVSGLMVNDLRQLTNEMVDHIQSLIAGCVDADVTFQPEDPEANDRFAANPDDVKLAWTLGHVIVHTTSSAEEAAALAAELARGVPLHGRSRSEIPWREAVTIAMCRARLEESRRMRLASLEMWPDRPCLDLMAELWPGMDPVNAVGRFVLGLNHDANHLGQIGEIVRQASAPRRR
jgi:hypothetical protein